MLEALQLLVLGALLTGYAIGNFMYRREFRGMRLALAIAHRVTALIISGLIAALCAGVTIFFCVIIAVLFKEGLGLSDGFLAYGTLTLTTLASLFGSLLTTRAYYRKALRRSAQEFP